MTQQQHENLSALVDGEHDDERIIDQLKNDPELAGKWQRYHLMGQAMRNEIPTALDLTLSERIAAAIDDEPAIVAPKRRRVSEWPVVRNVVPLMRSGGQFAIAASVAVATIVGVQHMNQPQVEEPFSTAPTLGAKGGLSPVSLEQTRQMPNQDAIEQKRRINAYLNDHHRQMRLKLLNNPTSQENESQQPHEEPPESR